MKRSVHIVEPGCLPHIQQEAPSTNPHVVPTNTKYQQYINSVVESQRKLSGEGDDVAALSSGVMADTTTGSPKSGLSDLFRNRVRPPCTANGVPVQSVSDYIRAQETGMKKSATLQAAAGAALTTKLPGAGAGRVAHKPRGLGSATTTSNYFQPKYALHQYNVNLDQDLDGKIVEEGKAIMIGGAHGADHVHRTPPATSTIPYKHLPTTPSKNAVDMSMNNAGRDVDGNTVVTPAGPNSVSGGYTGSFINANDEPTGITNNSPHTALKAAGFRGGGLPSTGGGPPRVQQHGGGWLTNAARDASQHTAVAHHDRPQTGRYLGFISEAINHPLAQRRMPSNLHPHLLTGPSPASQQYKSYVGKVLTGTTTVGHGVEKSPTAFKRPHTAATTTPPQPPTTAASNNQTHVTPKSQQGLRFALDVVTPLDLTPTDYGRKVPTVLRPSTTGGIGVRRISQGGAAAVPVREVILPATKDGEGHDVFNTGGIDAAAPPHDYHFV